MNKMLIIVGGIFGLTMLAAIVIAIWLFSAMNTEVGLRTRFEAQHNVVETTMDTMRKTLMNQYKINKEFADTFIKCVAMQAEGRKGGSLFKSVSEASGNAIQGFTPELSVKMMNSIEGKMNEFKRAQDVLTDVWREHKTYCLSYPQAMLLSGKVLPKPEVITSDVSKEAMVTKRLTDDIMGSNPVPSTVEK